MRKLSFLRPICLLFFLMCASGSGFAAADVPLPTTPQISSSAEAGGVVVDGLQLAASLPKTTFEVGDQIMLKVVATVTSPGDHPINSFADWGTFHISVKDAKGKDVPRTVWGKDLARMQAQEGPLQIVSHVSNPVMLNGKRGWVQFIVNREYDLSQSGN